MIGTWWFLNRKAIVEFSWNSHLFWCYREYTFPYSLAHCLNRINDISYPDSRYSLIHWNPLFCNFKCELHKNEIGNVDNLIFWQILTRILAINPRLKIWVTVMNYKKYNIYHMFHQKVDLRFLISNFFRIWENLGLCWAF